MSHVTDSYHIHMSHTTHMHETYEWVTSRSHATHTWVLSHIHESRHTRQTVVFLCKTFCRMWRDSCTWVSKDFCCMWRDSCTWVSKDFCHISRDSCTWVCKDFCRMWRDSCTWVTSHTTIQRFDMNHIYMSHAAHGGEQTSNIWISRLSSFPPSVATYEWVTSRIHATRTCVLSHIHESRHIRQTTIQIFGMHRLYHMV